MPGSPGHANLRYAVTVDTRTLKEVREGEYLAPLQHMSLLVTYPTGKGKRGYISGGLGNET